MCRPLEFGSSDEGVYSIQTWIDGVDAEENAHNLTSDEQYSYGVEAGRILKEIHKIPVPERIEDWEIYFNRKAFARKIGTQTDDYSTILNKIKAFPKEPYIAAIEDKMFSKRWSAACGNWIFVLQN